MGVRLGGPGLPPAGLRGQGPAGTEAPKIFDIFTENRPFRDLRVHDIGKSSQVECLCKTFYLRFHKENTLRFNNKYTRFSITAGAQSGSRTIWRGFDLEVRGYPMAQARGQSPLLRKCLIFLLKIDHSETSEFMILGSLRRKNVCARLSERQMKTIGHCQQKGIVITCTCIWHSSKG